MEIADPGSPEINSVRRRGKFFIGFVPRVGGFFVASDQDTRQRAVICQDCWFWREMSCALANPVVDVCANRRPVRGRAALPVQPQQAQLVPMAAGHAMAATATATAVTTVAPATAAPVAADATEAAARVPFSTNAPEATFSIAQVREPAHAMAAPRASMSGPGFEQPVRLSPPSFRDIRAGRTAAAQRTSIAEVVIPIAEVEAQPTLAFDTAPAGMEQMVERVRRRTAARLSRAASASLV